jgi:hypothetical protein
LAYKHGPTKLLDWIIRKDGTKRSFSSDFKRVYGTSVSKSWSNWIEFEKEFQNENIKKLGESAFNEERVISEKVLGGVSHAYHDKDKNSIYVAVNYPGKYPHIAEINLESGKVKRLMDVKGPTLFNVTSLAHDKKK